MQTARPVSMFRIFAPLLALSSCHSKPEITAADLSDVLTQAAAASIKSLPSNYCVEAKLEKSPISLPSATDDQGWVKPPGSSELKYRLVSYPDTDQLPSSALAAFAHQARHEDCRNPIVFAKPSFIETRSASGSEIEAIVSFSNQCPVCGAGYEIHFLKKGQAWELKPPGILKTWVS